MDCLTIVKSHNVIIELVQVRLNRIRSLAFVQQCDLTTFTKPQMLEDNATKSLLLEQTVFN